MTIPSALLPYINYILIALTAFWVIMGYRKGLLYQIFTLLAILAAILVSWYFAPDLASRFKLYPESFGPFAGTDLGTIFYGRINTLTWYALLFIVVLLLLTLLKPFAKVLMQLPLIGAINHLLGAVFSLLPLAALLALAAYFIGTPLVANGQDVLKKTAFGPIHNATANIASLLKEPYLTNEAVQKLINDQQDLTEEDVQTFMVRLISNDANTDEIEQFLKEHTTGVAIPSNGEGGQ